MNNIGKLVESGIEVALSTAKREKEEKQREEERRHGERQREAEAARKLNEKCKELIAHAEKTLKELLSAPSEFSKFLLQLVGDVTPVSLTSGFDEGNYTLLPIVSFDPVNEGRDWGFALKMPYLGLVNTEDRELAVLNSSLIVFSSGQEKQGGCFSVREEYAPPASESLEAALGKLISPLTLIETIAVKHREVLFKKEQQ